MKKIAILLTLIAVSTFGLKAQIIWSTNSNGINYNEGNVGIGTTTPATSLDVIRRSLGQLAKFSEHPEQVAINGESYISVGYSPINLGYHYVSGDSYGFLEMNGGSRAIIIKKNGNVGIGTTTPPYKLAVSNADGLGLEFDPSGVQYNEGFGMQVYNRSTSSYQPLQIYASKILLNGGNVGIGTTAPSYPLDILKQIDGLSLINVQNTSEVSGCGSGIRFFTRQYGGGGSWWSNIVLKGDRKLHFNMEQKEDAMLIDQAGNIGIGTTNPLYKLTVEGTIAAREVKVTAEAWSDFVFHPSYKLRTLGEVEQFIKNNSHLPEIPTATEVKENGVSLGEMNAKLLQKVEELTLYLIEQQKVNEKQNQLIKMLEQKIEIIATK